MVSMKNAALAGEMGVTVEDLRVVISSFPHMRIEESENPSHGLTVTWDNWHKYQEDTTMATRQRMSRSKRRGEESKKRKELSPSINVPHQPTFQIAESILAALDKCADFRIVKRLRQPMWWQATILANPGVDIVGQIFKAQKWLVDHPERRYTRLDRFLGGWIGRSERDESAEE